MASQTFRVLAPIVLLSLAAATPSWADEPIGQIKTETGQAFVTRNGANALIVV